MATNDMGPGPLKKARRLVKKITQKVTKGTFLEDSKNYPGEKNNPFTRKGGATKMNKYQDGGSKVTRAEKQQIRQGVKTRVKALRDVLKDSEYSIGPLEALKMRITGNRHVIKEAKNAKKPLKKAQDGIEMNDDMINKSGSKGGYKKPMKIDGRYIDTTAGQLPRPLPDVVVPNTVQKRPTGYKTGGMVNANANLKATATAGSRGVKAGVNPKAAASNVAKKPSKPRSKAPKKATPGRK